MTTWLPCWFACLVLVIPFVPVVAAAPAPPEGKAPPELLKAQRDAARKTYEMSAQCYAEGVPPGDAEKCYLWSRRWLDAERQLAGDGDADRAAVVAHLDRMKHLEEMTRKLLRVGAKSVTVVDAAAAAFYRAEAEVWVAQAKGK
jgi:hypothetical protein